MHGVIAARGVLIAENFDAQQADDGRDAMAIEFKLVKIFVAQRVQVHFAAFDELVKQREGQLEFLDDRLKFLVEDKFRIFIFAGAADVFAPGGELFAARFNGSGILVGHVIHGAAEGVERGHGVALFAGQQDESQREVGGAFLGERAAVLHGHAPGGGWLSPRFGGRPPVWANVGLVGRRRWRLSRLCLDFLGLNTVSQRTKPPMAKHTSSRKKVKISQSTTGLSAEGM